MKRRLPWFEMALVVVYLSATLYAAFSDAYNLPNRWFIRDDAYYYFKVAQNISEGRGSTFDGLHPTNGYHPLWLLICIPIFALARYDLILPLRVLAIVTGVLQVSTAVLLYWLIRRAVSTAAAMLAAAYWAFDTYILVFLYKTGVESSIALFLLVLLLFLLSVFEASWREDHPTLGRIAGFAIIAALAAFGRLDLVFFVLILGLWIVFRNSPMRYLLPLDILALAVSTVSAFLLRLGFGEYYDSSTSALIALAVGPLIKIPFLYFLRLYESPRRWQPLSILKRVAAATVLGSLAVAVVMLAGRALGLLPAYSRAIILLDMGLSFGSILLVRLAAYCFRTDSAAPASLSPLAALKANWRRWLGEGSVYYGIVGGALSAYMLWNRLTFGTFTPVSGQVKQWWGTFTHSIYGGSIASWLTFFALDTFSDFNAWAPPTTALSDWSNRLFIKADTGFRNPRWQQDFFWVLAVSFALACVALLLNKKKSVRAAVLTGMIPLFVGSWLQILGYTAGGYASPKEWYWLTEPLFLVILGATLFNVANESILKKWRATRVLSWILVAGYVARAGYGYWRDAYALNPYGEHPPGTPYTDVIPFLESHTEPGAVIGMTGGGNIAYLMPSRTVVNMDGLINSNQYFLALQAGSAADFLYGTGMRYVFANPSLLDANPYRGQFADRLRLIMDWGGKDLLRLMPTQNQ